MNIWSYIKNKIPWFVSESRHYNLKTLKIPQHNIELELARAYLLEMQRPRYNQIESRFEIWPR